MKGDSTPTISRVQEDGTLIELVYDSAAKRAALAVRASDGAISVQDQVDLPSGERLAPYSARNPLLTSGCVLLPSDIGELRDKGDLLASVQAFVHRYVDLPEAFEAVAANYILLTWVYDAFNDLPYLRFRGDFGTGKTRALLTIGSLCYKAFFASGASTVSPIFHIQDAFQGTLVLDEADFRFSDATSELTKVFNNGTTNGLPVLRTMTNRNRELHPVAFRVFGPKVVAMRQHFSDDALESRFITHETVGQPRTDIAVHLPAAFKGEAQELRNRLLAWRFAARQTIAPDPTRLPATASPRAKQSLLALLSIIDDEPTRVAACATVEMHEASLRDERRDTLDAAMVNAILAAFRSAPAGNAAIADIAANFNAAHAQILGHSMSNKWVGSFVRKRLRVATMKTNGVYVVPATERPRIDALAQRNGVGCSA